MKTKNMLTSIAIMTLSLIPSLHATSPSTVVEIAIGSQAHTTLVTAVVEAELAATLSSKGPFTVFAPVNDAFAALPEGTVETLLKDENLAMLQSILTYHVLPGNITAAHLKNGLTATTVQWDEVVFQQVKWKWYINGAQITVTDLTAENGVVHVIDAVLLPSSDSKTSALGVYELRTQMSEADEALTDSILAKFDTLKQKHSNVDLDIAMSARVDIYMRDTNISQRVQDILMLIKQEILSGNSATNSIVDIAIGSEVHSTLVTAVVEANLVDALSGDGPFTVFAPVNDAFEALPDGTLTSLLAQESKADLTSILTYHVVSGAYFASDITDDLELTTLSGDKLMFSVDDAGVTINGLPTLLATDLIGSNGVVHVIKDVLMSLK